MNIKNKITKIFAFILRSYHELRATSKFRIEEIDLNTSTVIVHRIGSHTIFKLPIADVMCDAEIISNIPSEQACWLGYYCGKMCNKTLLEDYSHTFSIRSIQGNYKISSQDRKGNIVYFNSKTQEIFTATPIEICENENVIKQFDPSQACYIGILAGKAVDKHGAQIFFPKSKKPHLTLVK